MSTEALLGRPFGTLAALIRAHAHARPAAAALVEGERRITYAELDARMDRVAAALARDGAGSGAAISLCGTNCLEYALLFLGALRAGVACALIPPSATAQSIARMEADAGGTRAFRAPDLEADAFEAWLAPPGTRFEPPAIAPEAAFNIIYSSGTTGMPKGIVQPHAMRWLHLQRGLAYGYGPESVTLVSTPLHSNTTLVAFFPTLALGGCVVLTGKFDAADFLASAASISHPSG